ncbi:SGNH hydrolase-type esterase domain-containing protein [Podospora appendiculata]|uniref:SGNH hydrolase-type esterase domain-containing protein n=1 Tax=Podospora appendiculata TaxID=314037 RepID=A0AAE0XFW8_9PEZI|nr:SGNH hydrolase-type esterase domain-containing protein [Podospora appendiculata]
MLPLSFLSLLLLAPPAKTTTTPTSTQHVLRPAPQHRKTGFAAFGDSYSAGIGTPLPSNNTSSACRRGAGAYPVLLAQDLTTATTTTTSFQWLSCTGATTHDLLSTPSGTSGTSQIDAFNASLDADFATLSIGGNDLGFFAVINACVFRFYGPSSGTCAAALAAADDLLRDPGFEQRLSLILLEILDRARWWEKPGFSVAVTGYARFFAAETDACDSASMSVWRGGPVLSKDIRRRMNALVDAVNRKLRAGVEGANQRFAGEKPRVVFVDFDDAFEGHRFCEEGVSEPDYEREDTWFFLPGARDVPADDDDTVAEMGVIPGDSVLVDPARCLRGAEASGDWGDLAVCYMAMARRQHPELAPSHDRVLPQGSMWYVPTYYGKTFHPRSLGHRVVRDQIYKVWEENGL